jgi:hypothetical protein
VPDFTAGSVPFSRALEILEITPDALENLLNAGSIRGYRRGQKVMFKRQDLAAFITRRSDEPLPPPTSAPTPGPAAGPVSVDAPPPPSQPSRHVGRDSKHDTIKKAAMGGGDELVSLKKKAVEQGLVPAGDAPPAPPAARHVAPQTDAETQILRAENESLRARLKAAEEVLNDLQRRCENAAQYQGQNQVLVEQVRQLQVLQTELEAKLIAYEEMDTGGAEGPRWGQPDAEQEVISFKRQVAELRGDMAAGKRRLEDKEKDFDKLRMERDELSSKLNAAATPGVDIARIKDLEAEIVVLKQERDTLAVEAQVAQELKGEIERASELEEKLQTQREVIEAAQKGLAELETERDEIARRAEDLEQQLADSASNNEQVTELVRRIDELEAQLSETQLKAAQADARSGSLREERDKLMQDLERRGDECAQLKVKAEQACQDVEVLGKLKADLQEAKARASTLENETSSLRVQMSLKDQLLEQFRAEGRTQTDLMKENARLQERLLKAETHAQQLDARLAGMRAERDSVAGELAKRDGAMGELRTQSEKAATLMVENKTLKSDVDSARERIAELESRLEAAKAKREELQAELQERTTKAKELEKALQGQERDLGSIRQRVEGGAESDESSRLRGELEALRGEISRQVMELGQMRVEGEQATTKRRSALEVAARRRLPPVRKGAAATGPKKPTKLGRFDIGEESRRTRTGTFYKASLGGSAQDAEVLVLPVEVTRDRYFLDRFWREMRIVVELEEPGLLDVLDVGEAGGVHYVAYRYVKGETLEALLRKSATLPLKRSIEIGRALLEALAVAEKNKVVHGDLKPENVIIGADRKVRLSGLGLARGTDEDASSLGERGRVVHYGAPEQILGEDRDARSDIWGVGALLLRMVSGKNPLEAGSLGEIRGLVQAGELPRVKDVMELPNDLRSCLEKMLAEKPGGRFASADDAAKALAKVKV